MTRSRKSASFWVMFGGALLFVLGIVAFVPMPAHAFGISFPGDPSTVVQGEYPTWALEAQGLARNIYLFLLIFELIALAITTLLFRENLGEFFASIGLKVLLGSVFFWLIANGPTLSLKVIDWFISAGKSFSGTDPFALIGGCFLAAGALFTAADLTHTAQTVVLLAPPEDWCVGGLSFFECPVGIIAATSGSHPIFVMLAQGVGIMILLAVVGIILQFAIVTIESYLVMSVGVLYIGFAGSRFTMPFSQGYFSYMINVGTKLMVTYIMLGVAQHELFPILVGAIAALVGAAFTPFGFTDALTLGGAAVAGVYVVLTAGLLWTIPAFTASLLSGQSQSSGFAILQQAIGSFAGASQLLGQFGAAKSAENSAQGDRNMLASAAAHAAGAGGASTASALTSQSMAPPSNVDRFGMESAAQGNGGALGGLGVTSGSGNAAQPLTVNNEFTPINPSNGMVYGAVGGNGGSSGNETLYGKTAAEIGGMQSGEIARALPNTDLRYMSPQAVDALMDSHGSQVSEFLGSRAERSEEAAALNRAYGLSGLAQAAPRDIGQPSAVQVRISNPDKV